VALSAVKLVILNQRVVVGDSSPSEVLTADIINQIWQYDPLMIKESEDSTPLFF
jgi:ABC-type cobalamin/Fe3+-siderophores transport system ATPase subunit